MMITVETVVETIRVNRGRKPEDWLALADIMEDERHELKETAKLFALVAFGCVDERNPSRYTYAAELIKHSHIPMFNIMSISKRLDEQLGRYAMLPTDKEFWQRVKNTVRSDVWSDVLWILADAKLRSMGENQ
jgi:hypothetical protein